MPTEIDRHELQKLLAQGAQLVDVLGREEYEESHLPGARHVPLPDIPRVAPSTLDRLGPVAVYCWDSA